MSPDFGVGMAEAADNTIDSSRWDWALAVHQRRKALVQRCCMGVAAALVFAPVIGWTFPLIWALAYFAVQIIEVAVFAPVVAGKVERLSGARLWFGGLIMASNAALFGSMSIPLWLDGGPVGGVCATMLMSAGAVYSTINAVRSTTVLGLTVTPNLLYLGAAPFFLHQYGASSGYVAASFIAVGVFGAYCLSTWQRMTQASIAETTAREEAEAKRRTAERLLAGRSAFLAAIGHDLRTPISAIMTGSAELERGAADGSARAQAQLISDAGLMMKGLLDDLLDHAKLDAGHMTAEHNDFNLRQLLCQTIRLWQGPVREKGLKLRVEGAARIPAAARGDALRLRQILNNLISNAMKFTAEGAITVRLNAWSDEPHGHALLIEIADTGPGMTEAQLKRLFTPFDQTVDGVSALHGGTGLGLAISRQLAELMQGRLTVRSRPGEGAAFTLALRLERGELVRAPAQGLDQAARDAVARALAGRAPPSPRPVVAAPLTIPAPSPPPVIDADEVVVAEDDGDDRPMRVLVVDDHDINRRAVQLILQPLGCDIATAVDGMAALKICEAEAFDLIFMDVRMPELDGRETTRRLRSGDGPNAATPVIAVTADTSPDDIAACNAAGMDYFVPKPITPPMLLGAISHVMSLADQVEPETAAA